MNFSELQKLHELEELTNGVQNGTQDSNPTYYAVKLFGLWGVDAQQVGNIISTLGGMARGKFNADMRFTFYLEPDENGEESISICLESTDRECVEFIRDVYKIANAIIEEK